MAARKNKKTWVIVVFADSKDYSVVPTKWLIENSMNNLLNKTVEFCYWPICRVTSAEIHDAIDPDPSWNKYKIKILGGNKTYGKFLKFFDNFKKAWHTRVLKESASENEDFQFQSSKKKRKNVVDSSDSSSCEDVEYCITTEDLPRHKSSTFTADILPVAQTSSHSHQELVTEAQNHTYQPLVCDQTDFQPSSIYQSSAVLSSAVYPSAVQSSSGYQSSAQISPTYQPLVSTNSAHQSITSTNSAYQPSVMSSSTYQPSAQSSSAYLSSSQLTSEYQFPVQELQPTNTQNPAPCAPSSNFTSGFESVETKLNNILQGQIASNLMLNRVLAKIDILEANLKNKSQNDTAVHIDPQFLSHFPIKNSDELATLENCIKNEFEFSLKLESFLKSIGGTCAENHIKRVMSKMFTDEYCVKISWTGRGWVKDMTKLKDTSVIQIIKKVVQESSSVKFTDSQFEKEITERLRTANTRFKSFLSRDNSKP